LLGCLRIALFVAQEIDDRTWFGHNTFTGDLTVQLAGTAPGGALTFLLLEK